MKILKGELDTTLRQLLTIGNIATVAAILGISLFAVLSFFTVPFVVTLIGSAIFASSMVYLSAMAYGIVNDIIGSLSNLPYFMLGHQPQQKSMIISNKPAAVGIAWGIAASAPLALLGSLIFGAAVFVTGWFAPVALFALPLIAFTAPIVLLIAHLVAKNHEQKLIKDPLSPAHTLDWRLTRLNDYQIDRLMRMSNTPEEKARWFANSTRNVGGFIGLPLAGIASGMTVLAASGFSAYLPALLFSPLFSTMIPLAIAGILVVGISAALIYLAHEHNKQIDNQYKLDFSETDQLPQEDCVSDIPLTPTHPQCGNNKALTWTPSYVTTLPLSFLFKNSPLHTSPILSKEDKEDIDLSAYFSPP